MKSFVTLMVCVLTCAAVFGELSEDQMKELQRYVRIASVRDQTVRDEDRNKIQVLSFVTTQSDQDTENYAVRVTVELADSDNNTYCVQLMRKQQLSSGYEYAGQDRWEVRIPEGDLSRPKINAYVIEYGKMDGEKFVPVALDDKDAESAEEIASRCATRMEDNVSMWHAFSYREYSGEGGQQQTESILKKLK